MSSMKPGEHSHGKTVVNRPLDGRYQRLVESARDVIYRLSPDGLITFLNPVFEQLTGWSAAEWIGRPFAPLVHEQDLPMAVEAFYRVLEGVTPPIFELRIVTQDGGFRIGEFFETPDIEDGTVIGVIGIGRDVTARKQVELALRESESTLKTFFHTSSVMMGLVQVDGDDILHLSDNPATAKFFGRSPESLKGRKASELGVPPEHLQLWISQYRECERLGHGIQFEYRHASSTTEHWLLATVSPVSNAAGRANRFAYVVEDITEWKRAEQRLRQAHEELERRSRPGNLS